MQDELVPGCVGSRRTGVGVLLVGQNQGISTYGSSFPSMYPRDGAMLERIVPMPHADSTLQVSVVPVGCIRDSLVRALAVAGRLRSRKLIAGKEV